MQIQAKWENGAFYPIQKLTLKHNIVTIDIPDEELEITPDKNKPEIVSTETGALLLENYKKILGNYYRNRPASTLEQDKAMLVESLEEKYTK